MTATEELRRMLDERGVEHYDGYDYTEWDVDGIRYLANDHLRLEGRMVLRRTCTPEQAIEATLGRGTCEPVDGYDDDGEEIGTCCSECGSPWPVYYVVRYCPVCGCKVVED